MTQDERVRIFQAMVQQEATEHKDMTQKRQLAGMVSLALAEVNPTFRELLETGLDAALVVKGHRELFGLAPIATALSNRS